MRAVNFSEAGNRLCPLLHDLVLKDLHSCPGTHSRSFYDSRLTVE